jgi:hypothetical protein
MCQDGLELTVSEFVLELFMYLHKPLNPSGNYMYQLL